MNRMIQVQDRLSLTISINGRELLFERVNVLEFLHISSSVRVSLPMLHLRYIDTVDWLTQTKSLFDGALIHVSVTRSGDNKVTGAFRLNSYRETQLEGRNVYDIDAYFDAPKYWNSSALEVFEGSSSEALQHIATQCDIQKTSLTQTADTQLWIPGNLRYHEWARFIANRGFASESSCMKLGFDLAKGLLYKNVFEEGPLVAQFGMAITQPGVIMVTSFAPRTGSGIHNNLHGYNSAFVEQLPLETTPNRRHEKLDVNAGAGRQLLMSGTVKSRAAAGSVEFGYLDPGNSNENYERGLYQNKRGASLFSLGADVLTPLTTNVGLLDDVTFVVPKGQTYVKPYSSRYKVISKTVVVSGIDYYEKFELGALSVNDNYPDSIVSSESGALTSEVN